MMDDIYIYCIILLYTVLYIIIILYIHTSRKQRGGTEATYNWVVLLAELKPANLGWLSIHPSI